MRFCFPRAAAPEFAALALVFGTVALQGLPVKRGHSVNMADVIVQILKKLNQTSINWGPCEKKAQVSTADVFQGASHLSLGFFFPFNSCISRLGVSGLISSI